MLENHRMWSHKNDDVRGDRDSLNHHRGLDIVFDHFPENVTDRYAGICPLENLPSRPGLPTRNQRPEQGDPYIGPPVNIITSKEITHSLATARNINNNTFIDGLRKSGTLAESELSKQDDVNLKLFGLDQKIQEQEHFLKAEVAPERIAQRKLNIRELIVMKEDVIMANNPNWKLEQGMSRLATSMNKLFDQGVERIRSASISPINPSEPESPGFDLPVPHNSGFPIERVKLDGEAEESFYSLDAWEATPIKKAEATSAHLVDTIGTPQSVEVEARYYERLADLTPFEKKVVVDNTVDSIFSKLPSHNIREMIHHKEEAYKMKTELDSSFQESLEAGMIELDAFLNSFEAVPDEKHEAMEADENMLDFKDVSNLTPLVKRSLEAKSTPREKAINKYIEDNNISPQMAIPLVDKYYDKYQKPYDSPSKANIDQVLLAVDNSFKPIDIPEEKAVKISKADVNVNNLRAILMSNPEIEDIGEFVESIAKINLGIGKASLGPQAKESKWASYGLALYILKHGRSMTTVQYTAFLKDYRKLKVVGKLPVQKIVRDLQ